MENVDKICPICRKHPITLPNGVCSVCYNKVKTQADWNTAEWGKIENHGLDAIIVLAKYILDEIEDDDQHQWHLEKPRDFDPFGHAGFAHLWLQYD